jgi:hypothetical protein
MSTMDYTVGPLRLVLRGGIYHAHGTLDGRRIRQSTGERDIRRARVALDNIHTQNSYDWRPREINGDADWADVAKWVCVRHRTRAKEYGVPFELDPADVFNLLRATGFRCAVSGIALTRKVGPSALPDPWSASLDRIEPRHGYLKDNVRVVCLAANLAMNQWGYDTLLRLAKAVTRNAGNVLAEEKLTHHEHNNDFV